MEIYSLRHIREHCFKPPPNLIQVSLGVPDKRAYNLLVLKGDLLVIQLQLHCIWRTRNLQTGPLFMCVALPLSKDTSP
jgi:hypothetical protein